MALPLVASNKKEKHLARKVNDEATILNLQVSIMTLHYFVKNQGYITTYQLELVEKLCTKYYKMGGNGFIHKIQDEILKMPIK